MADEHDRAVELFDDGSEIRSVTGDPAQGKRSRENRVLVAVEPLEHGAPARGVSESAVHENDRWFGHGTSFRLRGTGDSALQSAFDVPRSPPWFPWSHPGVSMSRGLAAVDVQRLAGDETRLLEVEDPLDDVADLTHLPDRVSGGLAVVGRGVVHRRLDHSKRDRVDPDTARGVLDGE